jgi:hypothetical protein
MSARTLYSQCFLTSVGLIDSTEVYTALYVALAESWRSREASPSSREKERKENVRDYLASDPVDRAEMLYDADWNLAVRQKTANISYVGGGLLATVAAGLLSQHFRVAPTYVIASYVMSLAVMVFAIFPALSELFRRVPKERTITKQRREKADPVVSRAEQLQADRYAQMKQRVYHLQRNTYRFRWGSALGLVILVQGLTVLPWFN